MGTKGPKAGNIYSSLKSRGLIGGKGKDPMLNCGSPFKVTDEKNKEKNKDNNSSNTQKKESNVGYIQDNESKIEGRAVRIIGSGSGKVLAERSPSPFKQTKDGSDASMYGKARAAVVGAVDAVSGVKGMAKNMVKKDADTPAKFNPGLYKALDNNQLKDNPKFEAAVENSRKSKSAPFKIKSNPKTSYGKGGFKKKGCYK